LATRDDQKGEMPPWKPGDIVMVNSKFKSNVSEAMGGIPLKILDLPVD
jgi:hypothetical protein